MQDNCSTSNPIPAKQIVDVILNWDCLIPPDCTRLEASLQVLVDAVCAVTVLQEIDTKCITSTSNKLPDIIQGIINKLCTLESAGTTTTTCCDILNTELNQLNLCTPDTWDCKSDNNCITIPNPCGPVPTTKEIIQALTSRIVKQSEVIKTLCDRLDAIESRLDGVDLSLADGCCDSTNLQTQINTINTSLNTINQNCC